MAHKVEKDIKGGENDHSTQWNSTWSQARSVEMCLEDQLSQSWLNADSTLLL